MKTILRGTISVFIVVFYFISIASAQTDENNSINGHNLSNQSYDIRVALDHIFISYKNNSLEISEIVVFRNEGKEIYYSKDNHTFFAISTPPDIKNLKTEAMECCLVQEDEAVLMDPMQAIKPGDNFQMQVSYTILPQNSEYVFNKSAIYNTSSLSIFVDKKGGMDPEGAHETLTLGGNEYNIISFKDIKAGETVSIPIKMTDKPDYFYAGIGIMLIFSLGMVYHFRGKILRKGKEYTLEELELEKRKIFQAIHGFEKHAGPEKSEEFRKLMEEYRQKAIQIFIKIDNLKNKGQSEALRRDETGLNRT
ncbi:MAG: hypothetical protein O8C64_06900 [Candidatus Methanoperedens sp.]|nr:hypothetical protein [Candidatus Methanoperedens sp.]MCZ7406412.1 hypothetical protein [Candidatus Methanoperedens sp.]